MRQRLQHPSGIAKQDAAVATSSQPNGDVRRGHDRDVWQIGLRNEAPILVGVFRENQNPMHYLAASIAATIAASDWLSNFEPTAAPR